jgi:hypothetical protein
VADGTRTHDDRNHNPGLYQLSYSHRCASKYIRNVRQERPLVATLTDAYFAAAEALLSAPTSAGAAGLMSTLKRVLSAL